VIRSKWFRGIVAVVVIAVILGGATIMSARMATGEDAKGERLEAMMSSPNWRDGSFVNSIEAQPVPFWSALTKWLRGADHTSPEQPVPIVQRAKSDFDTPPGSGLRITWLGHSTFILEIDDQRLLVDPVWSKRASPFSFMGPKRFHEPPLTLAELPDLNAVVISHDHYDHLDHETIQALADRVPLFLVPLGVGAHLEYWGVPPERIVERDWWGTVNVGNVKLTATPARHFSGRSVLMTGQNRTLWVGWVIQGSRHRVYYSGDTAMFPDFKEIGDRLGPFDVTLIEIGAYDPLWPDVHIGPEQAIRANQLAGGGLFIPVHWGTFDLALHSWTEPVERLIVAAEQAGVRVAIPRPGESIDPAEPPPLNRWWPDVPWRTGEEAPIVSTGLSSP
jgi:L-ascorbate metabolism protein UlaG (beta-lactamase superfamily)